MRAHARVPQTNELLARGLHELHALAASLTALAAVALPKRDYSNTDCGRLQWPFELLGLT